MQAITERFDSLATAYLAAHQLEHEGKCAVILDESMGSVFSPKGIRGIRVIAFTTADSDMDALFAQAAPLIEERETQPVKISPFTFTGLSCVTGAFIWTVFGLIFALFVVADFFDQIRSLPLSEIFSRETASALFTILRRAGDMAIWSSIEGFMNGAIAAPILGSALLVLEFRNYSALAKYLFRLIGFVMIAVLLIT